MKAARWAIAVRVSTEEQDVDQQEQALRAAAQRLSAQVVEVVRVEGKSAFDPKTARQVEEQMLAPIIAGRADVLAVWAFDRMTRQNIRQALAFLERLEKHLGGQLFSLTEPFLSTATMNPEVRELLASFTAWMANRESARKSERVLAKRDAKVNRAAALGQKAIWGKGAIATPAQVSQVWVLRDTRQGKFGAPLGVRDIAAEVGISKSQVARILASPRPTSVPMGPAGQAGAPTDAGAASGGGGLGQVAAAVPRGAGVPEVAVRKSSDKADGAGGAGAPVPGSGGQRGALLAKQGGEGQ